MKHYCERNNIYKFLSLLLFNDVKSIVCPSSVLITTKRITVLHQFFSKISFPLMIRLDYSTYPNKKFLGGVEVQSINDLIEINNFIIENKCFTLIQSYISRFENDFNMGLLLSSNDYVIVEYLGSGFDAGDLRLGKITPHEIKQISLLKNNTQSIKVCTKTEYQISRELRIAQIKKLLAYQNFVTSKKILAENIEKLDTSNVDYKVDYNPPMDYQKISQIIEKKIITFSHSLKRIVIHLPDSNAYVASLSVNRNKLLLWDIYGKWYIR